MICCKVAKLGVLICLWVLWSTSIISIHVKAACDDSLKPGDTLDATSQLCSKQGKCRLFFNGEKEDSYLVIACGRIVWMSDRNQPINNTDSSAVLSLDHSGVLKIESQYGKPNNDGNSAVPSLNNPGVLKKKSQNRTIILYSSPQPTGDINPVATLLDTGNFVLQLPPNGTKSTVLWQSFDYPANALLPTMKLGVNRKTGHNWSLVSWLTNQVVAPGAFSLEWEPKARELIIKERGRVCWKSGKLRNNGLFKNIPENVQRMYQYAIVSNSDEDSFTFKIKTQKNEKFPGWQLLPTGRLLGTKEDVIAGADKCYGYNSGEGCQSSDDIPNCRKPGDVFLEKVGSTKYAIETSYNNKSYTYSDCKDICWNNCSCSAFRELYDVNETGCVFYFWNSTKDVDDEDDGNIVLFHMLVKVAPQHGQKRWKWISAVIAATVIATALLVTCPPILCLALKKQKYALKGNKSKKMESGMLDLAASNESSGIKDLEDDLKGHDNKVLNYTSVLAMTNDFSLENKLGQGGYGPVYKGILPTGQEVAVKRLSKTSGQGIMEFKNELTLLCQLHHKNLIQLLGCCIHEEERILIYEYMPNKSLDFYLFDCTRRKFLDWNKRFNIIEGISQGLLYLHKYSGLKIIHRDLKASNILLDENMSPKISDFGMARMFTQQESTVNTNRIVGTYGYMSPEYAMEGVCSTKSDVYSFGVLLLEIVSGRRINSFYHEDTPVTLIGHAWELWKEGEWLQLMDPLLNDTFIPNEVQRCINVGLLCVAHYANYRPTMSDVISMLTNKYALVTEPRRPAFYVGREILEGTTTSKVSETYFSKEISTSSEVE